VIRNLSDLAARVGANRDTEKSIARRLFKDTECGISFWTTQTGVGVAGYCEGDVGDCPSYTLDYPFTETEFEDAVEVADRDGCELWDETHGCAVCGEEIGGRILIPVNPDCESCKGRGEPI